MALGLEIAKHGRFALSRVRPQGDTVAKQEGKAAVQNKTGPQETSTNMICFKKLKTSRKHAASSSVVRRHFVKPEQTCAV